MWYALQESIMNNIEKKSIMQRIHSKALTLGRKEVSYDFCM